MIQLGAKNAHFIKSVSFPLCNTYVSFLPQVWCKCEVEFSERNLWHLNITCWQYWEPGQRGIPQQIILRCLPPLLYKNPRMSLPISKNATSAATSAGTTEKPCFKEECQEFKYGYNLVSLKLKCHELFKIWTQQKNNNHSYQDSFFQLYIFLQSYASRGDFNKAIVAT